MTALWLFLKGVPWQVWAGAAAVILLLGWGQARYNDGWRDAEAKHEQAQQKAKAGADKETDRLRSGDRSRVLQFDRD